MTKQLKIKNILVFSFIFLAFLGCVTSVLADCTNPKTAAEKAQCGLNVSAGEGFLGKGEVADPKKSDQGLITDLPSTIGKIVGAGLSLLGVIFLLLIIYGGIVWMIARGNEQRVEQAKTTIEAAVIGLVIVLAAYAITYFIGAQLT